MTLCGWGGPSPPPRPTQHGKVIIYPWVCPLCEGKGRWESGERCMQCQGRGLTDDVHGWERDELTPAPRPPCVMKSACTDCALRPGSPEQEAGTDPDENTGFWCHKGMTKTELTGEYQPTAWIGPYPLGYFVCAGWWARATGQPLPTEPYRPPPDERDADTDP